MSFIVRKKIYIFFLFVIYLSTSTHYYTSTHLSDTFYFLNPQKIIVCLNGEGFVRTKTCPSITHPSEVRGGAFQTHTPLENPKNINHPIG